MKRIHVLEWEDLRWFPNAWRDYGTDYLQFIANRFKIYQPIIPVLERGLACTGNTWLDCASGGGGGLIHLVKQLTEQHPNLSIILSDYYPNIQAFERTKRLSEGIVNYENQSVNALNVPPHLRNRFRTLFGAFHHFNKEDARRLLQHAVDDRKPIALFEPLSRNVPSFFSMLFVPINVWLLTPFIRPVRWPVLPFIYLLPLIPLYILWDGIESILRMYSEKELQDLVASLENSDAFTWEIGKKGAGPMKITYLIGIPKQV